MTSASQRLPRTIFSIFLASGFASLIYQTVWIRKFSLILGGAAASMSVVVSTFMAGLAVGAAVLGRVADRSKRPLVLYAAIEVAIAGAGLVLNHTDGVRERMAQALIDTPQLEGTLLVRSALVVMWLGVPCFLIGGTLPVMVRFVVRQLDVLGQQVGLLYFVNTLGAAVGTLFTGFLLVELLGLSGTTLLAATLNVAVAAAALGLHRTTKRLPETPPPKEDGAAPVKVGARALFLPAAAFFVSGFCALVLEMAWTRLLFGYFHASVMVVSVNLFVVLLGFALGGRAISRFADGAKSPASLSALLFGGTALATVLGLASYRLLSRFDPSQLQTSRLSEWLAMVGLMLPATLLMGANFPVLVRVLVHSREKLGTELGGFYALNTLGTVLGCLATPFFFIPRIGTSQTVLLAVALLGVVALLLAAGAREQEGKWLRLGAVGAVLAAAVLSPAFRDVYHDAVTQSAQARFPHWSIERAYVEGLDSTVVLYEADEVGRKTQNDDNHFRIQVNVSPFVAFDTNETKLMAHLPLWAVPEPKRALVICFGMGNTFRSALAHGIDVDVVDINPAVPGLAAIHQKDPARTFGNPKGRITINDGRNFLLLTREKYDMVTIDPAPPIWAVGMTNIQSQEFFQLISDRLTDQGVAEAWMLSDLEGDFEATLAAFRAVFPHVAVFKGVKYHAYHVLGSRLPLRFSEARLQKLFSDPQLLADLGETDIHFFTPELIQRIYVTDTEGVDRVVAGHQPVTDDWPMLEYRFLRGFSLVPFEFPPEVVKPLTLVP